MTGRGGAGPTRPRGAARSGLDTLLDSLFDYAGMFPPADLELGEALAQAARFGSLRRPGMVAADLVVPLAHLNALDAEAAAKAGWRRTCTVCVVGIEATALAGPVDRIMAHLRRNRPQVQIVAAEVHGSSFSGPAMGQLRDELAAAGVRLFLEPRWSEAEWMRRQSRLFRLLAQLKETGPAVGLKVRGVGPTAVSHLRLGRIMARVAAAGVPFKITQGHHHPILENRHGNAHGFLNAAFALRWAQHRRVRHGRDLVPILAESDPKAYAMGSGVAWRGRHLDGPRIAQLCVELPFTIGSCSLHEPDDDLARLWGPFPPPG